MDKRGEPLTFRRIGLSQIPESILRQARRTGVSFCRQADVYGVFVGGVMAGFTGLLWRKGKVVFKHHYVLPEFRGRGIFTAMLRWSIRCAVRRGVTVGEASCLGASLPEYLRWGFVVVRECKTLTIVQHHDLRCAVRGPARIGVGGGRRR